MNTVILCVGKLKEKPYRQMADEYLKRLGRYGKYEESEVPDLPEGGGSAALEEQVRTKEGEALLASLPGAGHTLHVLDLVPPDAPERLCSDVGRFELLVNNAACYFRPGSPEDRAAAALYGRLNRDVPAELLRRFAAQDLAEGAAVNMVDCAVLAPGEGAYYDAKLALARLTETLAPEWGERGLRINAVAPGVIDTDMVKVLGGETLRALAEQTPLGRLGTPEDVAAAVAFLASDDAAFITGQVLTVDGGFIG